MHVRSEHVHLVVETDGSPERAIADFKAYATRRLLQGGCAGERKRFWSRGGSRVPLRTAEAVNDAIRYVIEGQGEPMAWHLEEGSDKS